MAKRRLILKTCLRCGKPYEARDPRSRYCAGTCTRQSEAESGRKRRARYSPSRRRAYTIVQSAIYHGVLTPQPCEVCGARTAHAHHDDYAQPLAVRWLCRSHHKQHHVSHGPGLNAWA